MKTILLWDPRFVSRPPLRLTVDDAIASAAVRSGAAAPANPADGPALLAGGPLAATDLRSAVLQVDLGTSVRVVLPASVLAVAQGLGLAAALPDLDLPLPPVRGPFFGSLATWGSTQFTFGVQ